MAWEFRELENFIERAVILTRGKALEVPLTELRKTETEMAVDAGREQEASGSQSIQLRTRYQRRR